MELEPVRNYSGARYPSLAAYMAAQRRRGRVVRMTLAAGLAMLAVLFNGCRSIS